jgi:hypothetical protein
MIFSRLEIVKMLRRAGMGNAPPRPLRLSLSKWTIRPSESIAGLPAAIANAHMPRHRPAHPIAADHR